jgi:predicted DNA-binding transcriptional regulator YafY
VRTDRLLNLLLLLHNGGRLTTRQLAERLEVSTRTVMRDIDALSTAGVPVYAVRGPQGGFEILDTFELRIPGETVAQGRLRRVRVRVSPAALRLAAVLGRPGGWRPRPAPGEPDPERADWLEGSFRFDSDEAAVRELLALGPDVEVLLPLELRSVMATAGRRIAELNSELL